MKKLGAFLAITSLLTLVPAVFAADGDVSTPSPNDQRIVRSEASPDTRSLPSPGQYGASNTPRSEDQVWHAGDVRPSGLYMGPDGVLHNVPKTQDPRMRSYEAGPLAARRPVHSTQR